MSELTYRAAAPDDAPFAADVRTQVRPSAPVDPTVLRHEWSEPHAGFVFSPYVVLRAGDPIGVAEFDHPRWERTPERFGAIGGELLLAVRDAETLDAVLAEMERRLIAEGVHTVAVRANEDDTMRIGVIEGRGFREDRRAKRWELDLVAHRERIIAFTAESRARMAAQGVRLTTLAEFGRTDRFEQIWRVSVEAERDVPTTLPPIEETVEDYVRWFDAPDIREDRCWVAVEDDQIVGLSLLHYPPVRGVVGTAWTATARAVRGRGIARAVKCETLMEAIALGVDRVRTGNDAANDPILHINASMGYQEIAGGINFLKHV
jgi:GNAT superfamily N-acetyltransferase